MHAEVGRRFRVVAGIDLTPSNVIIARRGAEEARRHQVPLVLVHALRVPPRAIGSTMPPAPSPEVLISTAHWLESVAEPLRAGMGHLPVSTRVIAGRADDVLIAESLTATAIVVGADQCGIVAAEIGHRGCSPLIIVRPETTPLFATIGRFR